MELHPRHQPMQQAKLAIMATVTDAVRDHALTFGELWSILSEIGASWSKGMIRQERNSEPPQ